VPDSNRFEKISYIGAITAVALGLYLSSLYSYLLFHSLIEITTIAIGFTLFILTWNTRRYLTNNYLRLLGIGYGFIALIDLLHTLAFKGMGVFPGYGSSNLPAQLWIAARYLQAVTLFAAPLFVERRLNDRAVFGGYSAAVSVLVVMVYSGNFPDCYIEGTGLTPFKIGSEYLITALLLASLYLFYRKRKYFDERVFILAATSIICTALSEILFTAFLSLYDLVNMAGHFGKLAAFYLIYRAILVTGLREPFNLIFKELRQAQEKIRKAHDTLEEQVRERTAELSASEEKYRALIECANDAVFIHEIKEDGMPGRFIEVNELACSQLGYSREELARLSPLELDDPRYRNRIAEAMERLLKDGHAVFETVQIAKDGRSIPVEVSTRVVEYKGTRLLFSLVRDITERKRAEEERLAHLRFLESMDKVNRAIQGANDLETMMSDVLDAVLSIFECDRAYLMYPCDPEAESWVIPMERTTPDYPGAMALGVNLSKDERVAGKLRLLLSSDGPINMGYGTPHMLSGTTAEHFSIRSMMAMAVYSKVGKPWEFGIHQCSYARVWIPEEKRLLQEIGRRLEDALTSLLMHRNLQESEAKYRQLVDTATEGIWLIGLDTKTSFVNARMAEMLGCSGEEMIGRPFTDFMFEEDVPDHLQKMDNRRKGISETYERRFRRKDGQTVWTHASATPIFDAEHHFNGSFGMFTDITERKQMEETLRIREREYRTLVENIPDLIVRYDPDLRRIYVNPAWEKASGLSAGEVINVPAADIPKVPKPVVNEYTAKIRKAMETGTLQTLEFTWVNARGVTLYLDYVIVPEYDQHGKVVSVLAVGHDITERKRAEEDLFRLKTELEVRVKERTAELEKANAKLRELDRLKSMFIASMSHELRTPLNSVIGFSSMLLNEWFGPINSEQKENLAIILRSGKHLLSLINDMIDVSKIEAGQIESFPEEFDLHDMIDEAVSLVKKELGEKGLVLRVTSPSLLMFTDWRRLLQCVLNLLSNAVKFTEQGSVTVETQIERSPGAPPESGFAEISVSDTGIGIREEDIGKMFQPFVRITSPMHAIIPGTGLGLYLTRKLAAEVLKGDIILTSEYGKGSRFTIRIPVRMP
jgi:PAS domain S-box-containing protein